MGLLFIFLYIYKQPNFVIIFLRLINKIPSTQLVFITSNLLINSQIILKHNLSDFHPKWQQEYEKHQCNQKLTQRTNKYLFIVSFIFIMKRSFFIFLEKGLLMLCESFLIFIGFQRQILKKFGQYEWMYLFQASAQKQSDLPLEIINKNPYILQIKKLMMANLEHDINQQRSKVITLLGQYQKISEQIIKSNYTSELHNLLDGIASFDCQKIKQSQNLIKDKKALQYLDVITSKIRKLEDCKQKQIDKYPLQTDKPKQIQTKEKPTVKQSSAKKQGGIFGFVLTKFSSKQKKATQMILPDEQPKCYYDPVTKSYVFEGQQPQAPKQIPKPPSVSQVKVKENAKKEKDDSELSQLTAPPAFKRKSTAASSKSKIKVKQEVQVVKTIDEPLTFARLIEEINNSFNLLLEKAKIGSYQKHSHVNFDSQNMTNEFINFAERTIQSSEEISNYQTKMIEKWSKIITSESRELQIMKKVLGEVNQSAHVYSSLMSKLEYLTVKKQPLMLKQIEKRTENVEKSQNIEKEVVIVKEYVQNQTDKQAILHFENQLEHFKTENCTLIQQKRLLEQRLANYASIKEQTQIKFLASEKLIELKEKEIEELKEHLKKAQIQYIKLEYDLNKNNQNHVQELKTLSNELASKISENQKKIVQLLQLNHHLQQEKVNLQSSLKEQKAKVNQKNEKWKQQIIKQKLIIEEQLKFKQQKERNYFNTLKSMQEHQNILQQYDSSLVQQHNLIKSILKTRLQSNKQSQVETEASADHFQLESSEQSMMSQLSSIIGLITQKSLDRLQLFSRSYFKLNIKYLESQKLLSKIKSNASIQSMNLNRCVSKFKALIETYKIEKQEAQDRCLQASLQCDKLRKKLNHYKQEDQFNKSYLTKLKPSKISSQDESFLSLQEDKEELTTEIDDLHKEIEIKNQSLIKNQKDIQDLLINYEKNQEKLLATQDKLKQKEKQVRKFKEICEKQENKIKLLELKLKNQKERYDEVQVHEESKIQSLEASFDKKLKLLKGQLDQSYQRENNLRLQLEEIEKQSKKRVELLQKNHHSIENQLKKAIKLKTNENNDLLVIIQGLNQKLNLEREQKNLLNERNINLMEIQTQLNKKMNDIIDEHLKEIEIHRQTQQNMNNIIATVLEKYNSFKQEQQQFKQQYEYKLNRLQEQLQKAHHQSNQLLEQITQYSNHIVNLNAALENNFAEYKKQRQIYERQIIEATVLIKNLRAEKSNLIGQKQGLETEMLNLIQKNNQQQIEFRELQQLIQKMSQQIAWMTQDSKQLQRKKADLQQQLTIKHRQIETLSNEVNRKSQQLLIKTQELLEKDEILLAIEEFLVTKKEQIDQLKNQLEKFKNYSSQMEHLMLNRQNLSRDKTDLEQKLMFKDRYIQTLTNELNKKSEELLIKTEELLEKDQALLENAQLSVMKREEFEELKNQLQHLKKQLQVSKHSINQKEEVILQKNEEIKNLNTIVQELNQQLNIKNSNKIQLKVQRLIEENNQSKSQIEALKHELQIKINELLSSQANIKQLNREIYLSSQRLKQTQQQLSQLKEKTSQQKLQEESKQVAQSDQIQGEMEYLLKQIESRQNQVERCKHELKIIEKSLAESIKQKEQLKATIQRMNWTIQEKQKEVISLIQAIQKAEQNLRIETAQKLDLINQMKKLKQTNKFLQLDLLSLQGQKHELYVAAQQQLVSIEDLSKKLQENKKLTQQEEKKQQNGLIQDLIADIRIKDESIIMKQQEIEGQEKIIIQLESQKNIKQQQMVKILSVCNQNRGKIHQLEALISEKDAIIIENEKAIKEYQREIEVLSKNNTLQSVSIQEQDQVGFEQIKGEQLKRMKAGLQDKDKQILELKNILAITTQQFEKKQAQYLRKIEQLQTKDSKINSIPANSVPEEAYNALLEENAALINQKVELMKSNNYLVSINQKLVGEKSSFNMREVHKAQSHIVPPSSTKSNESKQKPASQIVQKTQSKGGFFGTLSSLFLTPTQTDRLRK